MQQQQDPVEAFITQHEFAHPAILPIVAAPPSRVSHQRLSALFDSSWDKAYVATEEARSQPLHARCFVDHHLAFEALLAMMKTGHPGGDMNLLYMLGTIIYQERQTRDMYRKAAGFATIVGALMLTPFLLHKFFNAKKAAQ